MARSRRKTCAVWSTCKKSVRDPYIFFAKDAEGESRRGHWGCHLPECHERLEWSLIRRGAERRSVEVPASSLKAIEVDDGSF